MKHVSEIIREQLLEDVYVRLNEAEIIQHYIDRAGSAKKRPISAKADEGTRRIMSGSQPQANLKILR